MSQNRTEQCSSICKDINEINKYHKKKYKSYKSKEHKSSKSLSRNQETYISSNQMQHSELPFSSLRNHKQVEEDFRFNNYKYILNKVFITNLNLIHDVADFWKFVEKYETVKKRLDDSDELAVNSTLNSIGVPEKYHKYYCLNLRLNLSYEELFAHISEMEQLTKSRLLKFKDIIVLYLDFNQREKFSKLKKLRDMQDNLPITQYKKVIMKTIKEEKVIIIAGDTGCGKSTQIPQYLYEAGFQRIGKVI
jgi:HrpA-like RNA helicase